MIPPSEHRFPFVMILGPQRAVASQVMGLSRLLRRHDVQTIALIDDAVRRYGTSRGSLAVISSSISTAPSDRHGRYVVPKS